MAIQVRRNWHKCTQREPKLTRAKIVVRLTNSPPAALLTTTAFRTKERFLPLRSEPTRANTPKKRFLPLRRFGEGLVLAVAAFPLDLLLAPRANSGDLGVGPEPPSDFLNRNQQSKLSLNTPPPSPSLSIQQIRDPNGANRPSDERTSELGFPIYRLVDLDAGVGLPGVGVLVLRRATPTAHLLSSSSSFCDELALQGGSGYERSTCTVHGGC